MGYSGAGGKLIDEKNQKQKISWHCPFKLALRSDRAEGELYTVAVLAPRFFPQVCRRKKATE